LNNKSDEVEDPFALTDIKPKRIDDLNRAGRFYHIAYVCGPKYSNTLMKYQYCHPNQWKWILMNL